MTFLQGGRRTHAATPRHTLIQPISPVSFHPNYVFSSRWTTPDISIWTRVAKDPQPFNLYMFRGNNPISKVHHIRDYVTGGIKWLGGSSRDVLSSTPSALPQPSSSPTSSVRRRAERPVFYR